MDDIIFYLKPFMTFNTARKFRVTCKKFKYLFNGKICKVYTPNIPFLCNLDDRYGIKFDILLKNYNDMSLNLLNVYTLRLKDICYDFYLIQYTNIKLLSLDNSKLVGKVFLPSVKTLLLSNCKDIDLKCFPNVKNLVLVNMAITKDFFQKMKFKNVIFINTPYIKVDTTYLNLPFNHLKKRHNVVTIM